MKYKFIPLLPIIILFMISGCKKFVEIDPPVTQLIDKTVFESGETANAALLNIYSGMLIVTADPYVISSYSGLYADELKNYSTNISLQQIYTNNLNARDNYTHNIWDYGYNYIYQANAIIEGCSQSKAMGTDIKTRLIAEAMFIRAFWNFYLVNYFGDIPLVINTDYITNSGLARSTSVVIYEQIIKDLLVAQSGLKDGYAGADGLSETTERVRPNKSTATALLARAYLYTQNYAAAAAESSKVIDQQNTYSLVPLQQVFLKNSKEAIWQLMMYSPSLWNTPEGSGYILQAKPSSTNLGSNTISPGLLSSFEPGDQRKEQWVGKYIDAGSVTGEVYYYPYKYKIKSGSVLSEYSMVFRLAEQYLIRAESRARLGMIEESIKDVDALRGRAGLDPLKKMTGTLTQEQLFTAILQERRVELFTEWGHRLLDLKRTGKITAVMTLASAEKGGKWADYKERWPIPLTDLQTNPNMQQNQGYN